MKPLEVKLKFEVPDPGVFLNANLMTEACDVDGELKGFGPELERHQLRRDAGVPTISVLVGAPSAAIASWQQWSFVDRGRSVVIAEHTEPERIVRQWLSQTSEVCNFTELVCAWLAEASGRRASELVQALSAKTAHERDVLLQPLVKCATDRNAAKICHWILQQPLDEPFDPQRLADAMSMLFAGQEHPTLTLAAINRLMPNGTAPTLLVVPPENVAEVGPWIYAATKTLIRFSQEAPSLPVAFAIPAIDFRQFVESAQESRGIAMLRETVLWLEGLESSPIRRHIEESLGGAASWFEESIGRLLRDGCSDELAGAFTEAARAVFNERKAPSAQADDTARSAAERFLFERLQSLPETRGLFELNGKLSAEFGPRDEAEVDLLGRPLRMAMEIDGYYHFQDSDGYRRDRRKDVALQKLDYFVLRVLAEDVVMRLGETLDVILDVVSFRREHVMQGNIHEST